VDSVKKIIAKKKVLEYKLGQLVEKHFVKIIVISYFLTFLLAYFLKPDNYFFSIINGTISSSIILTLIFTVPGLVMYPVALILMPLLGEVPFLSIGTITVYHIVALSGLLYIVFLKGDRRKKEILFSDKLVLASLILLNVLMLYHKLPLSYSNDGYVMFFVAALAYFVVAKGLRKENRIRIFVWLLLLASMLIAFKLFQHGAVFGSFILNFNPNGLSRNMAFILPLVVFLFWGENDIYLKSILFFSLSLIAITIIRLGSLATYLVTMIIMSIIIIKNIKKRTSWLVAGMMIFIVILFSPMEVSNEFTTRLPIIEKEISKQPESQKYDKVAYEELPRTGGDYSISERTFLLKFGLERFKERPIVGWGPGQFMNVAEKNIGRARNAHNSYIGILVEWGFFGFIIYILLFISSLVNTYKAQKLSKGNNKFIFNLSQGTMFSIMAVGLNNFMIDSAWNSIVWIGFGLSAALYHIAKNSQTLGGKNLSI